MTFDQLVSEVNERLNYSSPEATTRVGKRINERYRRATSSIGLQTSRFIQTNTKANIGDRTIVFNGLEKVLAIIDKSTGVDIPLTQITLDEMHTEPIHTQPPRKFAVVRMGGNTVSIYVDGPPTTAYTLYADGMASTGDLSGSMVPEFAESFHDLLVFGAMADEYRKLEKFPQAADMERQYEGRLSDLRMWIIKSSSLDIYQGKYPVSRFPWANYPRYWNA